MEAYKNLYLRTADGIKPGLEVINQILNQLGNPHQNFAIIHVAGTNGKGSVSAMIESVLRENGFKTGLFTSPHLLDFSERYRINGKSISKKKLNRIIITMEKVADDICAKENIRNATFFEISTAIAFQYFSDEKVDIAIIEVGMGGRWDATNVVIPVISVITHIGMDHTNFLGNTIIKIASEKAGIIKKGRPVVSAPQDDEVKKILEIESKSILYSNEVVKINKIGNPQKLKIETMSQSLSPINLSLLGEHQRENCSVAVLTIEMLGDLLNFQPVYKKGLENIEWPGRFMKFSESPPAIIDGAHNPDGARNLVKTLKEIYPKMKFGFIVGFLDDKDIEGFIKNLSSIISKLWVIPMDVSRGNSAEESVSIINNLGIDAEALSVKQAWMSAKLWTNKEKDKRLIVATGSLRLIEIFNYEEIFLDTKLIS